MANLTYRGNLSAESFPLLSNLAGRTVIANGADQVTGKDGAVSNAPEAFYMHNVVPTTQGYKSVGYKNIVADTGVLTFDRVITVRDPDMQRGWIGFTTDGKVYIHKAGDAYWTNITDQALGWKGETVSVAYANGYTYICLAGLKVFKVSVALRTITPAVFTGLISDKIVSITSSANYLIVTDGVAVYWSSTIDPEDFVPSQVTGAGSGKPNDAEGIIIALIPLGNGFAVYTSVNIVVAAYSQNARFPWIFKGVDGSKGVSDVQHVAYSADDNTNYVWSSAGLQRVSITGASVVLADVTDFLAGQEFEDFDTVTNTFSSKYVQYPFKVKLAYIAARYLVVSYGINSLTHALVFDTALKRWGKLKLEHAACFEISLNTDGTYTNNASASPKKTVGFVSAAGAVSVCNFNNNVDAPDSVLLLGKYQILRSRTVTLSKVCIESVDKHADLKVLVFSSLDGKTLLTPLAPIKTLESDKYREYGARVTAVNHSVMFKGNFNLTSLELVMYTNGRR